MSSSPPGRVRAIFLAAGLALSALTAGCSGHASTSPGTSTSEGSPHGLWRDQAVAWSGTHAADLRAISTSAGDLATASKGGDVALVRLAVTQFLLDVGRTDGSLPDNAFGRDMHTIMHGYLRALTDLRTGVSTHDNALFTKAAEELSHAVTKFSAIGARMAKAP